MAKTVHLIHAVSIVCVSLIVAGCQTSSTSSQTVQSDPSTTSSKPQEKDCCGKCQDEQQNDDCCGKCKTDKGNTNGCNGQCAGTADQEKPTPAKKQSKGCQKCAEGDAKNCKCDDQQTDNTQAKTDDREKHVNSMREDRDIFHYLL